MGNICRSPTAHGVFLDTIRKEGLSEHFKVDSAGTHAYHVKEPPDIRAQEAALKRDIDLSMLRARKAVREDFLEFDYILVMDKSNYRHMQSLAPESHKAKLKLFLDYAPRLGLDEVPDPYYGGKNGFERVLDMIEVASQGLLKELKRKHRLKKS